MKIRTKPLLALLYLILITGWAFSVFLADLFNMVSEHPLYPYFLVGDQTLFNTFWTVIWGLGFFSVLILLFNIRLVDRDQKNSK